MPSPLNRRWSFSPHCAPRSSLSLRRLSELLTDAPLLAVTTDHQYPPPLLPFSEIETRRGIRIDEDLNRSSIIRSTSWLSNLRFKSSTVSSSAPPWLRLLPMLTPQMSLTTTRLYHAGILPHKSPLNHTGIAIHPGSHVIFSTTAVYCYCCSSASAATILITWIKPLMTQITIEDQALLI
ncbi:hypothetical protein E3N88_05836 [Mikania micrantha]|uniref:Uncharacterized protein n=1 Tax=Mikania micrantha TaxID=192012 RepID=A0A5N6PPD5_9ASTR|nr:hypothetical protein E3N88_05836 [Mikania micrantha]